MALKEEVIKQITDYVKKEPRTIQDVSRLIGKSWVTTDSYVKKIKDLTGLVDVKTFRKGTQGALKVVFYNHSDSLVTDDVRENLYYQLRNSRAKTDFDFMEIFQYVQEDKKKAILEEYDKEEVSKNQQIVSLFRKAINQVYCFSGNLSFINIEENNVKIFSVIEELLKRKIRFKILTRVNIASISNLNKLTSLTAKYSDLVEIKHCYQPLRGFIIDDKVARFKNEEQLKTYKKGELHKNTRIFYEIYDPDWIAWLQKVFWNLFRSSIDYNTRLNEIKKIF
ncbi:hypothetical protein DRJ17_02770 [Candidatus Woesearchaeota archaeon]|nr:MAG: hypothetical protein DRJ17_02770 [Candidatus Woesearchaeota archaeon]